MNSLYICILILGEMTKVAGARLGVLEGLDSVACEEQIHAG